MPLLIIAFAAVFWPAVIWWVRWLDGRDLLAACRPTAAGAAQVEAEHPVTMPRQPFTDDGVPPAPRLAHRIAEAQARLDTQTSK